MSVSKALWPYDILVLAQNPVPYLQGSSCGPPRRDVISLPGLDLRVRRISHRLSGLFVPSKLQEVLPTQHPVNFQRNHCPQPTYQAVMCQTWTCIIKEVCSFSSTSSCPVEDALLLRIFQQSVNKVPRYIVAKGKVVLPWVHCLLWGVNKFTDGSYT